MKRIIRWGLILLSTVIVLLAGLLLVIQTDFAKTYMATKLSSMLSHGPDQRVEIEGIEGRIPVDIKLARVAVADRVGTWLELQNARLAWSPWDLLKGVVRINQLSAKTVALTRTSQTPEEGKTKSQAGGPVEIPGYLPAIRLEQLAVEQLTLGPDLIGQKAVLSATGHMDSGEGADRIAATLNIVRIDQGPPTRFQARAEWVRSTKNLSIEVNLHESPDGLLATLAKLHGAGAVQLKLNGSGPPDHWKGVLEGGVEQLGQISTSFQLRFGSNLGVGLDGSFQPGPALLSADWAPLLEGPEHFKLQGNIHDFDRIAIQEMTAEGIDHRIQLSGQVGLGKGQFETDVAVQLNDLARFEPLVQDKIGGRAQLTGSFSGSFEQPAGSLNVKLDQFHWDAIRLGSLDLQAKATALQGSSLRRPLYRIDSKGRVSIEAIPGVEPLPEQKVDWRLEAQLVDQLELKVGALSLTGRKNTLDASGELSLKDLSGRLQARLKTDDLATLAALGGVEANGSGVLQLRAEKPHAEEAFTGDLSLHLKDMSKLAPVPPELLGKTIDLAGNFRFTPGRTLQVTDLRLTNEFLTATAGGTVDFSSRSLSVKAQVQIPDLKPASAMAQTPLAGRLAVNSSITGPWDRLQAKLDLSGEDMSVDGSSFDRVIARLSATALPEKPQGGLSLEIAKGQDTLSAATDYGFQDNQLNLTGLKISAPNCDVHGDLRIDLQNRLLDGMVSGRIPNLSDLGRIIGRGLRGSAAFDARLTRSSGRQQVALKAQGIRLQSDTVSLRQFALTADFDDLYSHPKGQAKLSAQGFHSDPLTLDTTVIRIQGDQRSVSFTTNLVGVYQQKFAVDARGRLALEENRRLLELIMLKGRFGKTPFQLLSPVTVEKAVSGWSLGRLDLKVGKGHLAGSAQLRESSVAAEGRIQKLPLAMLHDFGFPGIEGSLGLDAKLTGSPADPAVTLKAEISHLQMMNKDLEPLPAADLEMTARLHSGRMVATARLSGLSPKPLLAECSMPLQFSIQPGRLKVPKKSELKASLKGDVLLGPLLQVLLPEEQVVSGALNADLAMEGPLDALRFSGKARLTDARYENLTTGTVLSNLSTDLVLSGNRLEIRNLTGDAGSEGKVTAQGTLDLLPEHHFPFHAKIELTHAKLLQTTEASGTAEGAAEIKGDAKSMNLTGNLIVTPVEARIPDSTGPDLPNLKVIEINKPGPAKQPAPAAEAQSAFRLGLHLGLDLPNRIFVRGRGLESEWKGRLEVKGTASQPAVIGDLELIRGYLDFMGKRLDLTDSTIQFTGSSPPDPVLNIQAQSLADDVTVTILATGTASAPELKLQSTPTLPQDEIMSRLLFGKSVEKISGTQALKIALALRTLAGGGAGPAGLMGRARDLLGVDQLDLSGGENGQGTTVEAGKYLSDGIYVGAEQGTDGSGGRVRVEMEIMPHVTVDSEMSDNSGTGIGLNWKYDY